MATDVIDACVINFDGDFDWQVRNILDCVRLTRSEVEDLQRLFYDLEQTLRAYWPGCIVMPFGSIVTGLGIKSSDADCYVYLPEYLKSPNEIYVTTAKNVLKRRSEIFQQLFAITKAKVPIVKFFHAPTQCECDVNFKSLSGVRNSKLIACLLHLDKRALHFAILIKYWSKVHKLTGTNLIPNYALILMAIFYLQQMNILPSVLKLQQGVDPDMVDNWDTRFNENYQHNTNNNNSLYSLLGGFFEYYSTYQYKDNIISPYMGYSVSRSIFQGIHSVPKEFNLYKENVVRKHCRMLEIHPLMCVQDPFEHSRNSSVAVYPRLFARFLFHLKYAADKFKQCSKDCFLQAILDRRNAPPEPTFTGPTSPVKYSPYKRNGVPNGPNRVPNGPNRVTKPKYKDVQKYRQSLKNMNLHALYNEANRLKQNSRRRRRF